MKLFLLLLSLLYTVAVTNAASLRGHREIKHTPSVPSSSTLDEGESRIRSQSNDEDIASESATVAMETAAKLLASSKDTVMSENSRRNPSISTPTGNSRSRRSTTLTGKSRRQPSSVSAPAPTLAHFLKLL